MVGGKLSLADVWAFTQVQAYRAGFLDGVPRDGWLEKLPRLKACVENVAALPAIKAYVAEHAAASKVYTNFATP
jgi:glutathione S-transferase